MKKQKVVQKLSDTKIYHITNVEELIVVTNSQLEDVLYIGEKIGGRNYRSDITFKTKKEAHLLVKEHQAIMWNKDKVSDMFVYNEKTKELIPFQKNDYLMYDRGYFIFDGTQYIFYDDNGNEVGKFPFTDTTQ